MEENTNSSLFDLKVDENCKEELRGLSTWTKIVVITSVISLIFGLISVIMPKRTTIQFESYSSDSERAGGIVGYVIMAIISLLLAYFLYQFSVFAKRGVDNLSQPDLNKGLGNLKAYFQTYGILLIIVLVFVVLALVVIGSGALK